MLNKMKWLSVVVLAFVAINVNAQIGKRFPPERKVVKDPITGTMLTFLTNTRLIARDPI